MQSVMPPPPAVPPAPVLRVEAVGLDALDTVRVLNRTIFDEERVINTFDRADLLILVAYADHVPCGFKVGYRENRTTFYSAKGGVLPAYRRQGVARRLLHAMEVEARARGFAHFAYDTFPNRHAGMTVLGLAEGYRLVRADFNSTYGDYRLRFEKRL